MEHAKKVIVKPFSKVEQDHGKMKVNRDESFMRLLLHVARNDGYDESGRLKYRGKIIHDSDISSLISFTVMPLKAPKGLEYFLSFLNETNVDKTLISNQNLLGKINGHPDSQEVSIAPVPRTIITPVSQKNYQYEPVIQETPVAPISHRDSREENEDNGDDINLEDRDQPPKKRKSLIPVSKAKKQTTSKSITTSKGLVSSVGPSPRRGSRDRKNPERYGAGWFFPR